MTKKLIIIFFLLSACAKPTYIQENQNENSNNKKMEFIQCDQKIDEYCIKMHWTHFPLNEEDPGELQVRFYKFAEEDQFPTLTSPFQKTSPPENLNPLKIYFWMDMGNGKGHGTSPVTLTPTNEFNHTFKVTDIYLIMRGQWQIKMELQQQENNFKWEKNFDF